MNIPKNDQESLKRLTVQDERLHIRILMNAYFRIVPFQGTHFEAGVGFYTVRSKIADIQLSTSGLPW